MEKKRRPNKATVQKTLQERLWRLTQSLGEAEVGQKGIELIKEMKELYSMLEENSLSHKAGRGAQGSGEAASVVVRWQMPEHVESSKEEPS